MMRRAQHIQAPYPARTSLPLAKLAVFFLCLMFAGTAGAQELAIFDCNNVLRAKRAVDPGVENDVKVDVVDQSGQPAQQGNLTLTNVESGKMINATVEGGAAKFTGVGPGTWVVGGGGANVLVTSFSIINGISMIGATAGLLGGGAVIAGGGAGLVVAADQVINNNDGDPTPTPLPFATSTPIPQRPQPPPRPTATPCPDCNPDEDADEIDDFFGDEEVNSLSPFG